MLISIEIKKKYKILNAAEISRIHRCEVLTEIKH